MNGQSHAAKIRTICVLISGSGTNLQAIIDGTRASPPLISDAKVGLVISNRKAAYGLTRAEHAGIPHEVFALKPFLDKHPGATRKDYDLALAKRIREEHPDLLILAGFMHIVSDAFLAELEGAPEDSLDAARFRIPIINLHPALPGAIDGINAIQRAHAAFQKGEIQKTGVMVHYVVAEVDRGAPILVREVPMRKEETVEELEARIHDVEHEIIVSASAIVLDTPRPIMRLELSP